MFFSKRIVSIADISKYIVTKCYRDNCPISNLQLQDILLVLEKKLKKKNVVFDNNSKIDRNGLICFAGSYWTYCGWGVMPILIDSGMPITEDLYNLLNPTIEKMRVMRPWERDKYVKRFQLV